MKVIYTDQSLDSLQEGMEFLLEDLGNRLKKYRRLKLNYWTKQTA
jgi:hypothetical protein